ncbi:MAG: YIP1 family protein [Caldilineales bacterium]|nr:YIP1 family protein [Caldilineales bacterium]MDW8319616.1 YIP1 family protein [Anaerolineae bacterium]
MDFNTMLNRAIRAARLDVTLFQEVEHDKSLTGEARMVVIIVALLLGVGGFLGGLLSGQITAALIGLAVGVVLGIIGYYIWAYLTWFIGTRLFGGTAEPDELLRTLGYAYAPQALGVLGFIPCVGALIAFLASIWSLVVGVVAVREALNFDTGKAIITVVIGWAVIFVASLVLGVALGVGAAGLGALQGSLP